MTTRDAEDVSRPDVITPSNTTPTQPKRHSRLHRGVDVLPSSSFKSGRFGRMFRHLPVFEHQPGALAALAGRMTASGPPKENEAIPRATPTSVSSSTTTSPSTRSRACSGRTTRTPCTTGHRATTSTPSTAAGRPTSPTCTRSPTA